MFISITLKINPILITFLDLDIFTAVSGKFQIITIGLSPAVNILQQGAAEATTTTVKDFKEKHPLKTFQHMSTSVCSHKRIKLSTGDNLFSQITRFSFFG